MADEAESDDDGDPAAFLAAGERGKAKLAALKPSPLPVQLSADERSELARVCATQFPRFATRVAAATATNVAAPFFQRVRVLRLESAAPFPAQAAYAAWLSSGPVMLSGNPAAFATICADESPQHTSDSDMAVLLALFAGLWSTGSVHSELRLNSVDDIPFRGPSEAEAEIRSKYGSLIKPAGLVALPDGVRVSLWVASESLLRRRVSEVRQGQITVTETVLDHLPIPPGRMWGFVGNRLLPTG